MHTFLLFLLVKLEVVLLDNRYAIFGISADSKQKSALSMTFADSFGDSGYSS